MLLKVVPYRVEWPRVFTQWKQRIAKAISLTDCAIDHIGSTAVTGLEAKPIIDIQLRVASLEEAKTSLVNDLAQIGLEHRSDIKQDRPPNWTSSPTHSWSKLYFRTSHDMEHPIHLHVRAFGSPNARYALLFRDYLRADGVARSTYGQFKETLSNYVAEESTPGGTGPYLDLKDPMFDLLAHIAEQWAIQSKWNC